jgi:uncharacterized caspase-like protein
VRALGFLFLIFPVLLLAGCGQLMESDTDFYGLIIGINDYTNLPPANDLNYCEADATSIYNALLKNDWQNGDLSLLLGNAATKSDVLSTLDNILNQADENDLVLVYFSGHGINFIDPSGEEADGYDEAIVPVDYVPGDKGTVITDDELGTLFGSCKTQKGVFMIDCCYSGGVINKSLSQSSLVPKYIDDPITRGSGGSGDLDVITFPVMTAASQNEYSYEDPFLQHGIFTYFLIEGLSEGLSKLRADKNGDDFITVRELFLYAENQTELFIKTNYPFTDQHPVLRFPMDFIDILITR